MIKSAGIEFIRNEMDWDPYDAYGCVSGAMFDLAEAWYVASGDRLWEYERGTPFTGEFGSERARRLYGAMVMLIITDEDILYWSKVLSIMDELVEKAGSSY